MNPLGFVRVFFEPRVLQPYHQMAEAAMSLLVFYRWPHEVSFSEGPPELHAACQAAIRGSGYIVRSESSASRKRPLADTHTGVVFAKTRLDEGSRACFAHGPLLCRFKDRLPSAAVGCILSWGDRDVPSFADDVSMLVALVESHDHDICAVLEACTKALIGKRGGGNYKQQRRRFNDENECTKACQRLHHRRDVLHAVLVLKELNFCPNVCSIIKHYVG